MNNLVRDTPTTATGTLAQRLRAARESAGLSRAQLAKQTDIPLKAIEKFEVDDQEPSATRLLALCKVLGKSMEEMLGMAQGSPSPVPRTAFQPGQMQSQVAHQPMPSSDDVWPEETVEPIDTVRGHLDELDHLRSDRFKKSVRLTMAQIDELRHDLKFLEAGELMDLAQDRDANVSIAPTLADLITALSADPQKGQQLCAEIEERIIDTTILGADLFAISPEKLKAVAKVAAKAFNLEEPFFGWGESIKVVPVIREPLRRLALTGKGVDFWA